MPLPAALLCSPLSGLGGLPGGRFDDTETRRDETRRAKIGVSSAGPVLGSFKSGLGLGQRKRPRALVRLPRMARLGYFEPAVHATLPYQPRGVFQFGGAFLWAMDENEDDD
ncbi:hypothetical protein G7054_g11286 [Neopestalotiopsis clavispora]|nr:hypothetical protein G7054_g11286 [Neopestalotiopsis clavispora]